MTDENHKNPHKDPFEDKSGGAMLAEVGRLLLVLLGRLLKLLLKYILRALKFILKWICKGLIALIDFIQFCAEKTRAFWNDNNTQEKIRKIRRWLKHAFIQLGIWIVVGAKATWKGLKWAARKTAQGTVWLVKHLVQAIIHLGPTLVKIGKGIKLGTIAFGRWLVRVGKGIRHWWQRRQLAYRNFRRNKGFKGLLIDLGNLLKKQINNYIEEEQAMDESNDDNYFEKVDEEDEVELEPEAEDKQPRGKIRTFGKGIYDAMKKIVDD